MSQNPNYPQLIFRLAQGLVCYYEIVSTTGLRRDSWPHRARSYESSVRVESGLRDSREGAVKNVKVVNTTISVTAFPQVYPGNNFSLSFWAFRLSSKGAGKYKLREKMANPFSQTSPFVHFLCSGQEKADTLRGRQARRKVGINTLQVCWVGPSILLPPRFPP